MPGYQYLDGQVKPAFASAFASGDTAVVAAVTGKKIRVLSLMINGSAAVNALLRSGVTNITGNMALIAGTVIVWPESDYGWVETIAGQPLNINLDAAVLTGITIKYVEI